MSKKTSDQKTGLDSPSAKEFGGHVIGKSIAARLICDTGSQFFNPFLPIVAAGLQCSVIALGWLVSLRSITGLLSPVFGEIGDRIGYRKVMRAGLLAGAVGALLVGCSQGLVLAAVGMFVWGVGTSAFVPSLQAYLSTQLPYERRARGIGMVEYAWALAGIVGLFLMGWLIYATSWRVPLYVLAAGMFSMAFVVGNFPTGRQVLNSKTLPDKSGETKKGWLGFFRLGANSRSAYATMIGSAFSFTAAMQLIIAHGAWLEKQYSIGAASLGTIALVLGLADLAGSGLVSMATDRIGKRRSVLIGCWVSLLGYLILPIVNVSLIGAVLGIVLARFGFEFGIVSNIALLSEQVPERRGKIMTLGASFLAIGSALAAATGPWLYTTLGVWGLAISSASLTAIALAIYLAFVRE